MTSEVLERDGYTVLKRAMSAKSCAALDRQLHAFPMNTVESMGVRFAKNCVAKDPSIVQNLDFLSGLGLDGAKVLYDEVVETGVGFDGVYPCHQDGAYFEGAFLSVTVALSEMSGLDAGIAVVPCSQMEPLLQHQKIGGTLTITAFPPESFVPVPLQRFDVLVNHPRLVHQMRTNRSAKVCRLYSIVFIF